MSIATLHALIPDAMNRVYDVLTEAMAYIGAAPINPTSNKILSWNCQGEEVELKEWSLQTLNENNIQGIIFWTKGGEDFYVSLLRTGECIDLAFSEAVGNYKILELIFGYLMRTIIPLYRGTFPNGSILKVKFD